MKWREKSLEDIRKGQAEAAERRQRLLERQRERLKHRKNAEPVPSSDKASEPESGPYDNVDIDRTIDAVRQIRLMTLDMGVGPATALNRPSLSLLRGFLEVLKSRESAVFLQWPFGQRDVSLLHPFAMIALLCAPPRKTTDGLKWCDPAPDFRTLYYPWRGGANLTMQTSHLLRRDEIINSNKFHLTRQHVLGSTEPNITDMLHVTLGHLVRLGQRDTAKPHLAHPTLAEIYPLFVAEGGESAPPPFAAAAMELFGRVRFGAALDRMADYRPQLASPRRAPYGFFGVSSRAEPRHTLSSRVLVKGGSREGRPPDICLLDLGPPALNRLGSNWDEIVEGFVFEAKKRFPDMPFFVVTQDPYVHRRIGAKLGSILKTRAIRSKVLVRVTGDPLSDDPEIERVSDITAQFSTVSGPTADAISALSEAARGTSDPALAGTLRREMGSLRKAASLPCGLAQAYEFLCEEIGQFATETFLEYRSRGTLLAPIAEALESEIGGAERARLVSARDAVQRAFDTLDAETPIGSLFSELAATLARKSSRTIIVFASKTDLLLGRRRLTCDHEQGVALARRLEKGHLKLASAEELEAWLAEMEQARDRNMWKRLVLIAPNLEFLSTVAARSWLPDELIVVCERNLASRVADTFERLSSHPDLTGNGGIGNRLAKVAKAAKAEIDARQVTSIDLELDSRPEAEATEDTIDLTDDDFDDGTEVIVMSLSSGRKLRARPGSVIIRYNHGAEINPFERANAKNIRPGEALVVPDGAFLGAAREILPIRVLAQSWVDIYHATVEAQLVNIPGDSLNAKARWILADIKKRGARTQSFGAVLDWLKVEEHRAVEAERRQPHAPQRRREFNAFMAALDVNEQLAEKMWVEGIQPLRIDRRRAGQRIGQAFVSVLVDPHGTASSLNADVRDAIVGLRKKALDYVDQVVDLETIDGEGQS